MIKIQTLNTISSIGLDQFPRELYEVSSEIQHPDGILLRSFDMHNTDLPTSLRVVGRAGAGVNNIPVDKLTKLGIPVLNTPGANANAVRELVIAGMLMASRNLTRALHYLENLQVKTSEWHQQIEKDKKQFVGFELLGKTLGVVGLGNVGVKVANAAHSLGMKVIGYDPTITVANAWELSSHVKQAHGLDDLLMGADFVTFHVPLNPDTKHMLNHSRMRLMKNKIVILNFARDEIVEQVALIEALQEKKIHAYVTDFPNLAIKDFPEVISLPHLGASTHEAEENCAAMIAQQMRDFFELGSISHSVNFPAIEMPRTRDSYRIAISNLNIPNMVGQISTILGNAKLNILSLLNKSRNDIAYTLIDVNADIDANVVDQLCKIKGVVQVRKVI